MKKGLILALAICILFLSSCSSLVGTTTPASNSPAHSTAPNSTAGTQSVCRVLHDRQVQFSQKYQAASSQLTEAQAVGDEQQVVEAEKTLMRLHLSIVQVQKQLKAC